MTSGVGQRDNFAPTVSAEPVVDVRQVLRWGWRVVWSGKYMLLSCWLIAIVPAMFYLKQATVLYTSTASIMIEAAEATDAMSTRNDLRLRLSDSVVQTEVGVLTSRVLAERVIRRLKLDRDPEFNPKLREPDAIANLVAYANPMRWLTALAQPKTAADQEDSMPTATAEALERAAVVDVFRRNLEAKWQRRTFLIDITFISRSREKSALILNTLTDEYLLDRLEASFDDARRVSGWLEGRLQDLRQDVQQAETAVESFRASNGLRRTGDGQKTLTGQQLSELSTRLIIARTDLAQKQARLNQVRSLLQSSGNIESAYEVLQSPLIQRLREQESTLQREISEAIKTFGERHPRMVGYRADLGELQSKLRAETQRISESIANELEVANAGVRTLERELQSLRSVADDAGGAEIQLRELERQSEASRGLYEGFLQRFKKEAEATSGGQRANARVISAAQVPRSPSSPRTAWTLGLVSMFALGFGLALIFVLDRLDNAIRSSDDAEDITGLSTLSVVPLYRGKTENMIVELAEKPRSSIADAFRSLRVSLEAHAGDDDDHQGGRIIAMTSSVPREGKTFASLCLATMIARSGQRVLLIDSDIHRPRMHVMLGLPNELGLVHILAGSANFEDAVVRSVAANFDFLPAGKLKAVAEEVRREEAAPFLEEMRKHYDRVIIDLPPVLAVSDARVLSTLADQVIYLIRWNSTPRDAVRIGVRLLRDMNVRFAGVIISQINQARHRQMAYGDYGTYYAQYGEYYTK
jgi:polysaccharide biosynthesis transport protein